MKSRVEAIREVLAVLRPLVGDRFRLALAMAAGIGMLIGVLEAVALRVISDLATRLGGQSATGGLFGLVTSASTLTLIGVVAVLLLIGARWGEARLATRLSVEPMERVRERVIGAWLRADHTQQQQHRIGHVQELLTGHAPAVGNIVLGFVIAVSATCVVSVLAIIAIAIEPSAAAFLLAGLVVLGALVSPLQSRIRRYATVQGRAQLEYGTFVSDTIEASEVVQHFATTPQVEQRHAVVSRRAAEAGLDIMSLRRFSSNLYRSLTLLLLLVGLAILVRNGASNLSAASAVVLLLIRGLLESQAVYVNVVLMTEKLPFLTELRQFVDELDGSRMPTGDAPLGPVGQVSLNNVCFRHEPDEPLIADDVSLHLHSGDSLGISGPSGTGKSTLLRLILGLFEPDAGTVTIDGRPPRTYDALARARQIAIVPQDPLLLTASVRENVRFDRSWVSDDDVEIAARHAGLHDEIMSWPQGYDTLVGRRGARGLSGGQRQRISVARALAGHPTLLLMDEPTSALDAAAERSLVDAVVQGAGANSIVVVVSHRAGVLRSCDRVVELDQGHLREVTRSP